MYANSKNPLIESLTKSHKERQYPLGDLKSIKIDGLKKCIWCLETLKGAQRKWCSDKCSSQAMAWGYPQSEHGLHVLLVRQDFCCAGCSFSYMPYIEKALRYTNRYHPTVDPTKIREQISYILMKVMKNNVPKPHAPEVDHILAIRHGGQSIGLENHRVLCYTCHKAKTKIDNSVPRG